MKITKLVEYEDGSCSFQLDATTEEKTVLLEAGFKQLILEKSDRILKDATKHPCSGCVTVCPECC